MKLVIFSGSNSIILEIISVTSVLFRKYSISDFKLDTIFFHRAWNAHKDINYKIHIWKHIFIDYKHETNKQNKSKTTWWLPLIEKLIFKRKAPSSVSHAWDSKISLKIFSPSVLHFSRFLPARKNFAVFFKSLPVIEVSSHRYTE